MRFRPDIEFLRGLAIIAVFVFHLGPHTLPAGFLGVDIFFVLSGYLMASLFDPRSGKDVGDFLLRRARRILPAYFTVLCGTMIAAIWIVLPHEMTQTATEALYSAFLIPNIAFWIDNSYFDKAELKPLLHFWSLGVELQFYLLFPLLTYLHRRARFLAIIVSIVSFVTCVAVIQISPKTGFFLLPFRIWEFMIGFYATRMSFSETNLTARNWIAGIAILCMILPMAAGINENLHPGHYALIVSAATALVLIVGLPRTLVKSWPARALVVLGTYSYSVYLVHFPVIVFWFYQPFRGTPVPSAGLTDVVAILAIVAALSVTLFHMIETPMRRGAAQRYAAAQAALLISAVVLAAGSPAFQRQRFTKAELRIFDAWTDRVDYRCGKLARLLEPLRASCRLTTSEGKKEGFLLVGNSHADQIKRAMAQAAARDGYELRLMKQNCSLGQTPCSIENVAREVRETNIATVILHSTVESVDFDAIKILIDIGALENFRVVLIDPVPVWTYHVPEALYRRSKGLDDPAFSSQSREDYWKQNADYARNLPRLTAPNFTRYEVDKIFCQPACAQISSSGYPLYFDSGHLTMTGVHLLDPILNDIVRSQRSVR